LVSGLVSFRQRVTLTALARHPIAGAERHQLVARFLCRTGRIRIKYGRIAWQDLSQIMLRISAVHKCFGPVGEWFLLEARISKSDQHSNPGVVPRAEPNTEQIGFSGCDLRSKCEMGSGAPIMPNNQCMGHGFGGVRPRGRAASRPAVVRPPAVAPRE